MTAATVLDASAALLNRFRALGLQRVDDLRLTRNRHTMVSIRGRTLRVHRAYGDAPDTVHRAVVDFVMTRGVARTAARREIVAWAARIPAEARPVRSAQPERTHPDDARLVQRISECHTLFNADFFGGELAPVAIRVSRRMKARLGHYASRRDGPGPEIAISRRHIVRHGIAESLRTLLHEMVHQWQDEHGLPLNHDATFRKKAREVGISPRATRRVD